MKNVMIFIFIFIGMDIIPKVIVFYIWISEFLSMEFNFKNNYFSSVLVRTQFVGSELRIWKDSGGSYSSVSVDEPGFRRVWSSVFPDLGLGSAHFWLNSFKVQAFWRGFNGFEDWFWWMNMGSSEFEVWPIKFEVGLKFGFGVSSKFDLSCSKQFEVCYIWVRSNTSISNSQLWQ